MATIQKGADDPVVLSHRKARNVVRGKSTHGWFALFSIVMCVGAVCVEIWTVGALLKAKESEKWPTVTGKILRSELMTQSLFQDSFEASIEYNYRVGDTAYQSREIRPRGATTRHRVDVEPLVKKYLVGMEVPVRYNPVDPAEAYLEVGVDFLYYLLVFLPIVFAMIFGVAFYEFAFGSLAARPSGKQA